MRIERSIRFYHGSYQLRTSEEGRPKTISFTNLTDARAARDAGASARPRLCDKAKRARVVGVHRTEHNPKRARTDDGREGEDEADAGECTRKQWQVRLKAPPGSHHRFVYGGQFYSRVDAERAAVRLAASQGATVRQRPSASTSSRAATASSASSASSALSASASALSCPTAACADALDAAV